MKSLPDNFVVDPESTPNRKSHESSRLIEVKFEQQCREVVGLRVKREEVKLNPLAEALKGLRV